MTAEMSLGRQLEVFRQIDLGWGGGRVMSIADRRTGVLGPKFGRRVACSRRQLVFLGPGMLKMEHLVG